MLKRAQDPALVNKVDSLGRTALFWASSRPHPRNVKPGDQASGNATAIISRLIEAGATVYLVDNYGRMATHLISWKAPDVRKFLADAIPRQVESFLGELDKLPQHKLGERGHAFAAMFEVLVGIRAIIRGPTEYDSTKNPWVWADENRHRLLRQVVEGLQTWEPKPARTLMQAVPLGSSDLLQRALKMLQGPLKDMDMHDTLRSAAYLLEREAHRFLKNIVLSMTKETMGQIILEARKDGSDFLLKTMLEYSGPLPASKILIDPHDGSTMLHIAAERGLEMPCCYLGLHPELLSETRSKSAALNRLDKLGRTALHRACLHGHDDVVQMLLSVEETDPSIRDAEGKTLLDLADRLGEKVRTLLKDEAKGGKGEGESEGQCR